MLLVHSRLRFGISEHTKGPVWGWPVPGEGWELGWLLETSPRVRIQTGVCLSRPSPASKERGGKQKGGQEKKNNQKKTQKNNPNLRNKAGLLG